MNRLLRTHFAAQDLDRAEQLHRNHRQVCRNGKRSLAAVLHEPDE
jgi:hypothetical protein